MSDPFEATPPSDDSDVLPLVMNSLTRLRETGEKTVPPEDSSWDEYRRLILNELERLHESHQILTKEVSAVRVDVASLKVKAGIWGLLGGLIPALVLLALMSLK